MLCKSQFPVGSYFEQKLDLNLGDLGTGGSVASACWNFAKFCGGKNIFTAGLDLSFPRKQTHIKGSSAEQTFHTLSCRLHSVENFTAGLLFGANATSSQNYLGEEVTTDSRMKMFAWWFESRLASCPEVSTFTLCPQSMKIPGIEVCDLQKALSLPEITEKKESFLSEISGRPALSDKEAFNKLKEAFPTEDFLSQNEFLREYF